jgi:tRNA (uracil-5-)-methyltransferase TRM9
VRALLKPLRLPGPEEPPARFFIYVWAYEQGPNSRRKMGSLADAVDGQAPAERQQDVLVPWVLTENKKKRSGDEPEVKEEEPRVYNRYYHLFVEGELQGLVEAAARDEGFAVVASGEKPQGKWLRTVATGWEADNWWIEGEVGSF